MIKRKHAAALLFFLSIMEFIHADVPTVFSKENQLQRISPVYILEDTSGILTAGEVILSDNFLPFVEGIPNLQVSASNFWIRFSIKNETDGQFLAVLLESPTLDRATLYSVDGDKIVDKHEMGEHRVFSDRKYNDPNYIFDISVKPGKTNTFLLQVNSIEQMMIPLTVSNRGRIREVIADNNVIFGLYAGFILVMFFYNLFVFFIVRDNSYLYYITYLILIGLTQVALKGYTHKYLWPDSPWITDHSIVILSSLAAIAGMLFLRSFLQTRKHTPRLDRGLDVINAVFVLSIILSVSDQGHASFKIMQLDTMICSIYGLIVAFVIARKGYRPAKFFLLAWSILLGGAIIFVLKDFGVIPFNRYTDHTLQMASTLETILLSLALADRINLFKKEKEEAQARELHERVEKQTILEKQAEMLRVKVEEATLELREKNDALNKSNERLEETLLALKATQAELVQKQKMASLGQLAAGVAHEVNNPLNIINVSLDIIERDFEEMQKCIEKFRSIETSVDDLEDRMKEAQLYTQQEAEYEEVVKEVQKTMERARRGVSRTAEIAQELRAFSKIDATGFNLTNINKEIDVMLDMMKYTLGNIRIEKTYDELPDVLCQSQKLNQAYQNLLTNAVEAIQNKGLEGEQGIIRINTSANQDFVIISFEDNGIGMTDEVKEKAFDPFFTTKGVAGKGLGLANVYGTIEEHNGKIEVETDTGKGTLIKLYIPIRQKK